MRPIILAFAILITLSSITGCDTVTSNHSKPIVKHAYTLKQTIAPVILKDRYWHTDVAYTLKSGCKGSAWFNCSTISGSSIDYDGIKVNIQKWIGNDSIVKFKIIQIIELKHMLIKKSEVFQCPVNLPSIPIRFIIDSNKHHMLYCITDSLVKTLPDSIQFKITHQFSK